MSLLIYGGENLVLKQKNIRTRKYTSGCKRGILRATKLDFESKKKQEENTDVLVERIKEKLNKLELSVCSYDTAWVAMVPSSRNSRIHHHPQQQQPCFPGCLEWVMENQKADGSWGLDQTHPSLIKDSLSSTLACVLALKKWNVADQLVQKGLDFIGANGFAMSDKSQISPMGFDIIFPGMINYAQDLGLNLPLHSNFIDRAQQIQSNWRGMGNRLGYYGEGLGKSYEWEQMIKKEQRSNGSLFNSPATTAAALIHLPDDKCFNYLNSLVQIHRNAGIIDVLLNSNKLVLLSN